MNNRIRMLFTNRRTAYFLTAFLFVVTVTSLVVNRGLYYAYYHKSYELTLTGEVPAELWGELRTFTGVSKFDVAAKTIRLQAISYAEVNGFVNYIEQKGSDQSPIAVSLAESEEWIPNDMVLRAAWVTMLLMGVSVIYLYITSWRKSLAVNGFVVTRMISVYAIGLGMNVLFMLGILSLASRVYELTELSTMTVMITFICGVVLVYMSSRTLSADLLGKYPNLEGLYQTVSAMQAGLYKFMILTTTATLVIVGFGLGVRVAFDGLLIWLSVAVSVLCFSSLNLVFVDAFSGRWKLSLIELRGRFKRGGRGRKRVSQKSTVAAKQTASQISKDPKLKQKRVGAVQRRRGR